MSFGSVLRGYRLGFRYSAPLQAWMWIGADGPPHPVILAPEDDIPSQTPHTQHRCWWDLDPEEQAYMLERSPTLRQIRRVKVPVIFWFDDQGTLLTMEQLRSSRARRTRNVHR